MSLPKFFTVPVTLQQAQCVTRWYLQAEVQLDDALRFWRECGKLMRPHARSVVRATIKHLREMTRYRNMILKEYTQQYATCKILGMTIHELPRQLGLNLTH